MKTIKNFLRKPRYFMCIVFLPMLFTSRCFTHQFIVTTCFDRNLMLDARKCAVVGPPCDGIGRWGNTNTFIITNSAINDLPLEGFNPLKLNSKHFQSHGPSGGESMYLICQNSDFGGGIANGRAAFEYTIRYGDGADGNYIISFTNRSALTVNLGQIGSSSEHLIYHFTRPGWIVGLSANVGGSLPPYTYTWRANGEIIQPLPDSPNVVNHVATRNTEYKVTVRDIKGREATTGAVYFMADALGTGDPTANFAISPPGTIHTNEIITFNPSLSVGDITRWEWDFDWHGEVLEPFERTINGSDGTTTTSWSQPGNKYIRLRVTTATGNFHEIFKGVIVN